MSKKRKESQNDRILAYLKSGKSLKDGHAIRTDNVFKGSVHYAKYKLEDGDVQV